jgi:hypothetical protein
MAAIFRDCARSATECFQATVILEQFARDDAPLLVGLIKDADGRQYAVLLALLEPHRTQVVSHLV